MTHDEFMEKVKSAKSRLKGIDYYYFFAQLSIDYISELESEAKKSDAEIEKLKNSIREQNTIIMPLYTLSCKNCPPPYRESEITPDCPEHEPTCIECWLEWMAKQ